MSRADVSVGTADCDLLICLMEAGVDELSRLDVGDAQQIVPLGAKDFAAWRVSHVITRGRFKLLSLCAVPPA
eukprot:1014453-Amphidinium_carterae.1